MEIPVYLFTGFLEAGKTKFITETLNDPGFNDKKRKILVISCEEGEEEFDPEAFSDNVTFATFDDEQKLTADRISALQKRARADIVVIEYNGMWMLDKLYNAIPDDLIVYQEVMIADSTTILSYNQNMRQLVVDKLTSCDMVVFNRTTSKTDRMPLHKLVRGISRKSNICYEDMNGEVDFDNIEDPLPFDINAPVIEIADIDFAIFYRDMCEDFEKYNGKRVRFKGIAGKDPELPKNQFVIGRHIMTCCADDIAFRGVVAKGSSKHKVKTLDWLIVEGTISIEDSILYNAPGPVLNVASIAKAEKPKEEVATFY